MGSIPIVSTRRSVVGGAASRPPLGVPNRWRYEHLDLNEASLPDGRTIRRPVVTVGAPGTVRDYIAVVDSGSPVSVADSRLFPSLGIDIETDAPLFEVSVGV